MDNASIAERYRRQAEARLEMAGLLLSDSPAVQCNDHGKQHVTRADIGHRSYITRLSEVVPGCLRSIAHSTAPRLVGGASLDLGIQKRRRVSHL